MLKFLYHTAPGRAILKPLTSRKLSVAAGRWLDSPSSRFLIDPFLKKNGIDRSDYLPEDYACFNECFTRRIRPELRPIDPRPSALIAPSDGYLRGFEISDGLVFPVKESLYSIRSLLQNDELANIFKDGICLVFRLCVNHYHRYCFPDDGRIMESYFIPGVLHTVQPVALSAFPVFTENCRNIALLRTEHFGRIAQIEVGAMLVGRIKNHPVTDFCKGDEKGMFEYGGSTIIMLLEKDRVQVPRSLFEATKAGKELAVRQGQRVGVARNNCSSLE